MEERYGPGPIIAERELRYIEQAEGRAIYSAKLGQNRSRKRESEIWTGLQSRLHQFDSGRRLNPSDGVGGEFLVLGTWLKTVPQVSSFYGIVITMYFGDHPPPHFHARFGAGSLSGRALRLVREWLGQHRFELEVNWQRVIHHRQPNRIEPLQ